MLLDEIAGSSPSRMKLFFFLKEEKFSCLSNRRRNLDSSLNVKENIAAKKVRGTFSCF